MGWVRVGWLDGMGHGLGGWNGMGEGGLAQLEGQGLGGWNGMGSGRVFVGWVEWPSSVVMVDGFGWGG